MTDVEMKRGKMEKGGKTVKDGNMKTFECDSGSDLCVGTLSGGGRVGLDPRTDRNGITEYTQGWTRPVLASHGHRPRRGRRLTRR